MTDGTVREIIPWHVVEAGRGKAPRAPQPCIAPPTDGPPPPPEELWATLDACERENDDAPPPSGIRGSVSAASAADDAGPTSFRAYTVDELDVRLRQSRLVSFLPPPPRPWAPVGLALLAFLRVARDKVTKKTSAPWQTLVDAPFRALVEALRHALAAPSTHHAMKRGAVAFAALCIALFVGLKIADATDDVSTITPARMATSVAAEPAPEALSPPPAPVEEAAPPPADPTPAAIELDDPPPPKPAKRAARAKSPRRHAAAQPAARRPGTGARVSIRTAPF